ncbi:FAD-binding protein [Streptomyces sp. SBT349]|uniref:FAD-binding protein n=1 Tax=Streptomyces sp. SBT349 TaxID=1580539 RepID=UPI00066AE878|nr:FAD-binding protein [Streptomyces sp. SBT349]
MTHDHIAALRAEVRGPVLLPGEDGWDDERSGFNTAVRHRPDAVVGARGADDVRAAVAFARARGLPVAVLGTGHGPSVAADHGVLITTRRMTALSVDPVTRTARLGAGVRMERVAAEAAPHGLAPLGGSAPFAGAVGYLLGGGLPVLGRTYGWGADRIRAIDVVTPDATARHITAESDPDLFWALRGARDNFGVVTGVECELIPLARLFGGGLFFDGGDPARARELLTAWQRWTETVPEEMNTSVAMVRLPDAPGLPEPVRGRYVVHIRIATPLEAAEGERLVAPLRALGPRLIDTLADLPWTRAGSIHGDPPTPMAWNGDTALLDGLAEAEAGAIVELGGPGAPVPSIVEIRLMGGALSRPGPVPSAVGHRSARYILTVLSRLGNGDAQAVAAAHRALIDALAPRTTGRFLTFMGFGENAAPDRVRTAYEPEDLARLARLKARFDPRDTFRLNHHIEPATGGTG